ncbi:MAG: hypothetical protein ACUVXA_20180 [Candidatus Jordarchaeum sp.]|uniref:hypothetical protein n=1 Tax=Candidatus Jordarchaeum sp. TaxID=2823881 RepID=UPI00404B7656
MVYPKIYLVIDNCFAIKRWVKPSEWMDVIKNIGFSYVEASTDNEYDPLFSTRGYMEDWINEVSIHQKENNMRVVNFYTGYQTYRTIGLAHHDRRIRKKLFEGWHKKLIRYASRIKAGIGFSFFALPDKVLQDPKKYKETMNMVLVILSKLAVFAWDYGQVPLSVEQMYAPHQPPWTIEGAKRYLKDMYNLSGVPSYITIDVGHQVGQRKFKRPDIVRIKENLKKFRSGEWVENLWLGPQSAYELFFNALKCSESEEEDFVLRIQDEMDRCPYFFADEIDGDTYKWLEELGCYSPIIHMQQTDGITSNHAPFTKKNNIKGIIKGDKLLKAIAKSYEKDSEEGMPPKSNEVYLTFEIFSSNTDINYNTIQRMKETLYYWRQFVPYDGLTLNRLI